MELKSHSVANDTIAVIELTGRFDAYEEPAVRDWLDQAGAAAQPRIVVNLSEVTFIDSSALATLVQGMKHCREQNGNLHLCNLQQPVRIIFELTRLDRAFDIFQTETEAVAAFTR